VSDVESDLAGLALVCDNPTCCAEAGNVYYHLPQVKFECCGQAFEREALLCVSAYGGYPSRLLLSNVVPKQGNWFIQQVLARNWHSLSISGIVADRPAIEILAEHLRMLQ